MFLPDFFKTRGLVTDVAMAPGAFSVDFFRAEVGGQILGSKTTETSSENSMVGEDVPQIN